MDKAYQKILNEFLDENIYITQSIDELEKEIQVNHWCITGSKEDINSLSKSEWKDYMLRLIDGRQKQLENSNLDTKLIFYCWYDEQAGYLAFNLINNNHSKLPFGAPVEFVSLEKIIDNFTNDISPGIIPMEELVEISKEEYEEIDDYDPDYKVEVHQKIIEKSC